MKAAFKWLAAGCVVFTGLTGLSWLFSVITVEMVGLIILIVLGIPLLSAFLLGIALATRFIKETVIDKLWR